MSDADCPPPNSPYDCPEEADYFQSMAAEYMRLAPHIDGFYFMLVDQYERQFPQLNVDPLYGEPASPVRPEESIASAEQWHFRDPVPVSFMLLDDSTNRDPFERGADKERTLQAAISVYDFKKVCCKVAEGLTDEQKNFIPGSPRPGDVVYLGGDRQLFYDVDERSRTGHLNANNAFTGFELTLIWRQKYTPDRKDVLPQKETMPIKSSEGEGLGP